MVTAVGWNTYKDSILGMSKAKITAKPFQIIILTMISLFVLVWAEMKQYRKYHE